MRVNFSSVSTVPKRSTSRFILIATAVAAIGFTALPAHALCTSTSQCPSHMVCMNSAIPGIKECKQQMCNTDSECPSARPRCLNGACMVSAGTGGGTTGGGATGGTLGEVGQNCGPYKIGQVTKSLGCKQGLQCVNGTCQLPAR